MTRIVFGKVMWVGRATVFCVGLAVILAVGLGVATTALAAVPGDPFKLGQTNTIDEISRLIGDVNSAMLRIDNGSTGANATALDLRVESGKAPMKVDSDEKVAELNADKVDGKSASAFLGTDDKAVDAAHADRADRAANAAKVDGKSASEIGVNGLSIASDTSDFDSDPSKDAEAQCPAGKAVVGTGYNIAGQTDDVVVQQVSPQGAPRPTFVTLRANAGAHSSGNWYVTVDAICATAP